MKKSNRASARKHAQKQAKRKAPQPQQQDPRLFAQFKPETVALSQWTVAYDSKEKYERDERQHDIRAHDSKMRGLAANKKETEEQFVAARKAVDHILKSGALGEGDFHIHIRGHVNPHNEPRAWHPTDQLHISIVQKMPEEIATSEETQ